MNKTFKYAISVVLGAAMVTPAFAQSNFPDVADTHWAFEAVNRLKKEGILTGYPDGTFSGKRMITRYEMATLIYAIYANLKNTTDGLDSQIKALEAKINEMGGGKGSDGADMGPVRDALKALRSDVSAMKGWGDDITMLKKMSDSYQKELTSLGVDVEGMKKELADLSARVKKLEDVKPPVSISGDINFFVGAGIKGDSGAAPINQDGRLFTGSTNGAGIDTLKVLHELGLKLTTTNETGAKGVAELVIGNAVGGSGFGNQSQAQGLFDAGYSQNNTSIYLAQMYVTFNDSFVGTNFSAKVGRQGLKISPFVMQRIDNTSYFENERYDNGEFAIDGANIGLKLGSYATLSLFLGTTSSQRNTNGNVIQPLSIATEDNVSGAVVLPIARTMGAVLNYGLGDKGSVKLSFVDFDSNGLNAALANRLEVVGADLDYKLTDKLHLAGGAGKSTWKKGSTSILDTDNNRVNASLGYNAGDLQLMGSYSRVEANYLAPGDWGRVGIFRNLNDVTTTTGSAKLKLGSNLSVMGSYSMGKGISVTNDAFTSYNAGLGYKINSNWNLTANYENTEFKNGFNGLTNPTFKFTTIGLGYDMGANTLFKLYYVYSDIAGITFPTAGANPKGGQVMAQLSVKF
jgi:hypothetical protein